MPGKRNHLWHPWLRIERVLRAILTERWTSEQWRRIRVEIPKVFAERRRMRRMGWFNALIAAIALGLLAAPLAAEAQ